MSQSLMSSRPPIPMEKLIILISRAVGRDANTPVDMRFIDVPVSSSSTLPRAASMVVTLSFSSSPFFFFFFAARAASRSAFFAALAASFRSLSSAISARCFVRSASSAARFAAIISPSFFGSISPSPNASSGISTAGLNSSSSLSFLVVFCTSLMPSSSKALSSASRRAFFSLISGCSADSTAAASS